MKRIEVVAAVIFDGSKVFATARGYGDQKGLWEFPGGKIEPGETGEAALIREIREELDVRIQVGDIMGVIEYDYPTFHLSMTCFACSLVDGTLTLVEAEDGRWLDKNTLYSVQWLPADEILLPEISRRLNAI